MEKEVITTQYKIDKMTYLVTAAASENAKETLHKKIEKLILRDMRQIAENTDSSAAGSKTYEAE